MNMRTLSCSVMMALAVACGTEDPTDAGGSSSDGSSAGDASSAASADDGVQVECEGSIAYEGAVTVSYASDVAPIFASKCIFCHHTGNPNTLDLTQPFDRELGLVCRTNTWPDARSPLLVVPGNPDASGLVPKVSGEEIDPKQEGYPMPLNLEPVTASELEALRTWISDGAPDDARFEDTIVPILGDGESLGVRRGKCAYCHRPGGQPPDVTDPFDPEIGLVDVDSVYGGKRIVPGDPDASVLIQKIDASLGASVGAPMPLQIAPLTAQELETVRTWITEGARDN